MTFEDIMAEIKGNLTGNAKQDVTYLMEVNKKYMNHEFASQIASECGKLILEIVPDKLKGRALEMLKEENLGVLNAIKEAEANLDNGKLSVALDVLTAMIAKVEDVDLYKPNDLYEYRNFTTAFEEISYRFLYKSKKEVRDAPEPFASLYYLYGNILVELRRYKEAQEAFEKALYWNPTNCDIAFEYAETFKIQKKLEDFIVITRHIFKSAYTPSHVAHAYRNFGFYFIEKKLWQEAIGCLKLSMEFERENKEAQAELDYIESKTGKEIEEPSLEKLKFYANKYDFPTWASNDLISLAVGSGKQALKDKEYRAARYFLEIAHGLLPNSDIKELLAKIPEEVEFK